MSKIIAKAIQESGPAEIDFCWAILKYKEIGILRKIKALCSAFGLDLDKVVAEFPKDENGRVLDYESRHMIHDNLITASKQVK